MWSAERCPCSQQGYWSWITFEVPPSPSCSMTPWFCDDCTMKLFACLWWPALGTSSSPHWSPNTLLRALCPPVKACPKKGVPISHAWLSCVFFMLVKIFQLFFVIRKPQQVTRSIPSGGIEPGQSADSVLHLLKFLKSFQWEQFWPSENGYTRCIYCFNNSNIWFTLQQLSLKKFFDYFSYSTLIFFPIDLCHDLLWYNHLLPKFSVLLHVPFLSFISCQQLHFLGLYTGVHLTALFQNATLNFV